MRAPCTIARTERGQWRVRHVSAELGEVEIVDASRETALDRMRNELQYRMELCPCSGVSFGSIELLIVEETSDSRPST